MSPRRAAELTIEHVLLASRLAQVGTYPPRNEFSLTDEGRRLLRVWLTKPVRRARDLRQEFLAKLIIARRYGKVEALDLVRGQERACRSWRVDLLALVSTPDGEQVDEWLVHSFRLNRVEGVLAWLAQIELEIERLP
jgi:hypothetical protein